MDSDRNFAFISSVDLKKFIISQQKKQIQSSNTIQYRSMSQKSAIQISHSHSFPTQTLITNVEVLCTNYAIFQANFQNIQLQVSSLSNRGHYNQLVNLKVSREENSITFSGAGFTHCVKINLLLKFQARKKYVRASQKQFQQNIQKLIFQCVKDINIYGITINSNPNSILLTKLLNVSQSFKKYNMQQQSAETDILVALSLINARRFILAGQILRKVSKFYVQKYNNSKSIMDLNKTQRSIFKQAQQEPGLISTNRSNYGAGRILQSNKFLHRAAKIQLLLAEAISHPSLVLQKLEAYHRCNAYSNGNVNPNPLGPDADLEDVCINMLPQIINFFLKTLYDKLEPVRIAALKSIQFFIETLGCSIGSTFLQILKQVILTYPCNHPPDINPNRIPYGLQQIQIQQKSSSQQIDVSISNIKNKILIDHYHHLLETLLSLMSQINRRIVISIFNQIILPNILSKNPSNELKLYLLRFSQKSIAISGADLNIQVHFIGLLLNFCQQKNISKNFMSNVTINKNNHKAPPLKQQNIGGSHNKHVIHNLIYFSHKILSVLKSKVLQRYSGQKLEFLLEWINKTLTYLGQNQMLSHTNSQQSFFVFTTILDFIISIYSNAKYDSVRLAISPIETILYFANITINNQQAGLPFEKILEALSILLKYHCKMDKNFELDQEIISRILQKSRSYNLSLKQLQILINVLQISEEDGPIILNWLQIYLGCIPHSTYDETYKVFCIMWEKSVKQIQSCINKKQLLKRIVKTMLDQYTVKGKAHQQAKQALIHNLIKNKSSCLLDLMEICLFNNQQPKPENYYSKKKIRFSEKNKKDIDHCFDSKGYKIDYQMFLQKISMAQLILTTLSTQKYIPSTILEKKFIQNFFGCMKNLIQSSSTKLKSKSLSLINHFLQNLIIHWKKQDINLISCSLIIQNIFNLTKLIIPKIKQSKLMYSVVFNIIQLSRCFEIQYQENQKMDVSQSNVQKLYQQTEMLLEYQSTGLKVNYSRNTKKRIAYLMIFKQFFKIWPAIGQAMCSPWQNIRQIYILLILQIFKQGIHSVPKDLKKKVLDLCKSLILSLIKSHDHNQRQAALKIFGCLIGLCRSFQNKDKKLNSIIYENLKFIKQFLDKIHNLTYDWDQKTVQIAQSLCEICLSEESRLTLNEKRKQIYSRKNNFQMQNSYLSFNLQQQMSFQKKNNQTLFGISNNSDHLQMKQIWIVDQLLIQQLSNPCPEITTQILNKIIKFRTLIQKQIQAKTEVFIEKQSFMEQNEEQFYDMGQQKAESTETKQKSQDDQLQFQDLGIIQLDDQQWGQEQQKSEKAIQKLSIKKTYKLSPSVLNPSKPQRIRSKRFHQNQFDFRQKIIVDQLQQKINTPNQSESNNQNQMIEINNKNSHLINNNNEFSNILQQKEKEQISLKKQGRQNKLLKSENYIQSNFREPLIIDDYDQQQDIKIEQMYSHNEPKQKKDKQEKTEKKQFFEKQLNLAISNKQKQTQRKTKKSSARKRKPSTGK